MAKIAGMLINNASVTAIITPSGSVSAPRNRRQDSQGLVFICVEMTLPNLLSGLRGERVGPLNLTEEGVNMGPL